MIPGWTAIGSTKDRAAFDVPGDFSIQLGVLFGQETKAQMVLAHCGAFYQRGVCGKQTNSRTSVGLVTHGSSTNRASDPVAYAKLWAKFSNTDHDTGAVGPVPVPTVTRLRTVTGLEATVATIAADDSTPDKDCPAPRFRLSAAAIELPDRTRALLIIDSDLGIERELSPDIERQIISSLRPL
ncbi:hypothetical protein [Enemella dayhoffiae]|uniref:hypothetical protein n=1 Tax=Enemella dayhoffiae TaxID=2016507 RepID=UPI001140401B|nr:hypothetical protein [Enemella dayhoffiae]